MLLSEIRELLYLEMAVKKAHPSNVYWHGTTGFLGKKIAKEGVLKTDQKSWDVNDFVSRKGHVYLSSSIGGAFSYAQDRIDRNKKEHGSRSTNVAIVKVLIQDQNKLVFDEENIATLMWHYYKDAYHPWNKNKPLGKEALLAKEVLQALGIDSSKPDKDNWSAPGMEFLDIMDSDEYEWEEDDWIILNDLTACAKNHMDAIMANEDLVDKLSDHFNSVAHQGEIPVEAVWLIDLKNEVLNDPDHKSLQTEEDLSKVGKKIPVAKG